MRNSPAGPLPSRALWGELVAGNRMRWVLIGCGVRGAWPAWLWIVGWPHPQDRGIALGRAEGVGVGQPEQQQEPSGTERQIDPVPDHGEESYRGSAGWPARRP